MVFTQDSVAPVAVLPVAASPLVAAITQLVQPWQSFYSEHTAVSTLVLFLHLSALVLAAGLAVANDRSLIGAGTISIDEQFSRLEQLSQSHRSVISALVLSFASGALLLLADVEAFLAMRAFWIKVALIMLLILNATMMRRRERQLRLNAHNQQVNTLLNTRLWSGLRRHAYTSLVLWFGIVLAGTAMTS